MPKLNIVHDDANAPEPMELALANLATVKATYFAAIDVNQPARAAGVEAGKLIAVAKRPLTWALVDVSAIMPGNQREDFIADQAKEISAKLGESAASSRKTLEGLRKACITYVDATAKTASDRRAKADATTVAQGFHREAEAKRQKVSDRKVYGDRANALAANHMGMDVEDFRAMLEDGDREAQETKLRFVAILKNSGNYVTTVVEGYPAATDEAKAEIRRAFVAAMGDDDKAAWLAALN